MDIKQIQELVKLINKTNIGEITIEEEGVKITVNRKKIRFKILLPAMLHLRTLHRQLQPLHLQLLHQLR